VGVKVENAIYRTYYYRLTDEFYFFSGEGTAPLPQTPPPLLYTLTAQSRSVP